MFWNVAGFEFRYQLRQPAFWVISLLFALMGYGLIAASENISIGGGGAVHANAPFTIIAAHIIFNVFYMLATASIVANVVVRDVQSGFGPMIQATRLGIPQGRDEHLMYRFVDGAYAAHCTRNPLRRGQVEGRDYFVLS